MGVFALSDLHVDYQPNMSYLQQLSEIDYTDDTLILAGDVSDNLDRLKIVLTYLRTKFARIFFVPGNHELWVRRKECVDPIAKFWRILELCASLGVETSPAKVGGSDNTDSVWIVPLFSWYVKPEEGACSLFVPKAGEDPTLEMWSDDRFTRWPPMENGDTAAHYFLHMNRKHIQQNYDVPVISFSHFLPRTDLIFSTEHEKKAAGIQGKDLHPTFNFSRVAGCTCLEEHVRQLGSTIHVYGHQHRNRHRLVDGVLYISHCLGYTHERKPGTPGVEDAPKLIWDTLAR